MSDVVAPPTDSVPTSRWSRFSPKRWSRRTWIIVSSSLFALLLIIGGTTVLYIQASQSTAHTVVAAPSPTPTPSPTPIPKDHPDPLNGELYTADEAAQFAALRPLAIMVENHVEARPQSGLNEAEVLYEAMAEGGITRFMALYLHNQPEKIGPVRSARKHFVEWAAEYDATYAHWGGSAEALGLLGTISRPKNLDEFQNASAFYRDYSLGRSLEHTGYTSIKSLRQVNVKNKWEAAPTFKSWVFKDEAVAASRPQAQTVTLAFLGNAGYVGSFTYRPETNDYARSTGGKPHVDAAGVQLTAKTIVLMYQNVQNYSDAGGHAAVRVTTIGSGKAVVIEDGVATEGIWNKPDRDSRTILTDKTGKEISLNRGKLWVISVPNGSAVSY